ncbi:CD209 antigen-like protein E [Carassius carassius]|uniref:CD209 antigen-like protein E n=1 Tax=Carassius carassius TaxID=217509 RepID=UPI00286868AF|nr:CD209 antigen-like protein E [Carassius carassius]
MSEDIYDDAFGTETEGMKRERMEMTVVVFESIDHVRDYDFKTETNTNKPLQCTGSESVKVRSSRASVVCLVLLCVLLLTAVIVLCVHIYTNCTEETKPLLTNHTNLTEERKELEIKITNLTEERKTKRDQLINQLSILDEWIYYQFSFYYKSNEKKNWTESRQDCLKKGADLIIINNRTEQDFVMKITNKTEFWIGVSDIDVEDTWKWVDGSALTSGFWATGGEVNEPRGGTLENCAVSYIPMSTEITGWHDVKCNYTYHWICEKSILSLI